MSTNSDSFTVELMRFSWAPIPRSVRYYNELRLTLTTLRRAYRELQALGASRSMLVELDQQIRRIRKLVLA